MENKTCLKPPIRFNVVKKNAMNHPQVYEIGKLMVINCTSMTGIMFIMTTCHAWLDAFWHWVYHIRQYVALIMLCWGKITPAIKHSFLETPPLLWWFSFFNAHFWFPMVERTVYRTHREDFPVSKSFESKIVLIPSRQCAKPSAFRHAYPHKPGYIV